MANRYNARFLWTPKNHSLRPARISIWINVLADGFQGGPGCGYALIKFLVYINIAVANMVECAF